MHQIATIRQATVAAQRQLHNFLQQRAVQASPIYPILLGWLTLHFMQMNIALSAAWTSKALR
jgi:hypothetical protein